MQIGDLRMFNKRGLLYGLPTEIFVVTNILRDLCTIFMIKEGYYVRMPMQELKYQSNPLILPYHMETCYLHPVKKCP